MQRQQKKLVLAVTVAVAGKGNLGGVFGNVGANLAHLGTLEAYPGTIMDHFSCYDTDGTVY